VKNGFSKNKTKNKLKGHLHDVIKSHLHDLPGFPCIFS